DEGRETGPGGVHAATVRMSGATRKEPGRRYPVHDSWLCPGPSPSACVKSPKPSAAGRIVRSRELIASRRPVDLVVLGWGSVPADLADFVGRPVLPHD